MDRDELLRVFRTFEAAGLEYVLIGATAMGFHGVVRATEDLDLFIRATAENVERFLRHCARIWALNPQVYPRGVFKFRSIEDARHPNQ